MQNVRLRRRTTHDVHSLKHYSPDIAQAIVVEPIALDAGYLPGSRSAFDVRQQKSERETAGRERAGKFHYNPGNQSGKTAEKTLTKPESELENNRDRTESRTEDPPKSR
jgi:hypothetical protein